MSANTKTLDDLIRAFQEDELIRNAEIVRSLEEELGYRLDPDLMHLIDVIPDPWLVGTFAMRFRNPREEGDAAYFLLTPDGLEQVDFAVWPPIALGVLK